MPPIVQPVRRIVTIDDESGASRRLMNGPSPDVRTDPARPGYIATRIWVTETTPAHIKGVRETSKLPHTIEPPPNGSLFRLVTFPPEASYRAKVSAAQVAAFFQAMGSPAASTYTATAPHPYMQKTRTLDLCLILEGEITLVLDTEEVHLTQGDTVVQRGTNHAWSNRSAHDCIIAFSLHDAAA
jgi:uncharacterized cupin superfamily protein